MCTASHANPYVVAAGGSTAAPFNTEGVMDWWKGSKKQQSGPPVHRQSVQRLWELLQRDKQNNTFEVQSFQGHGNTGGYYYDTEQGVIYKARVISMSKSGNPAHLTNLNLVLIEYSNGGNFVRMEDQQVDLKNNLDWQLRHFLWSKGAITNVQVDYLKHIEHLEKDYANKHRDVVDPNGEFQDYSVEKEAIKDENRDMLHEGPDGHKELMGRARRGLNGTATTVYNDAILRENPYLI